MGNGNYEKGPAQHGVYDRVRKSSQNKITKMLVYRRSALWIFAKQINDSIHLVRIP